MKEASMSLGIYFEIKDAELYGGEGKKLSWDREAYADRDYPHMSSKGGRRR